MNIHDVCPDPACPCRTIDLAYDDTDWRALADDLAAALADLPSTVRRRRSRTGTRPLPGGSPVNRYAAAHIAEGHAQAPEHQAAKPSAQPGATL